MIYAAIMLAIVIFSAIARILYLNKEVKELNKAAKRFGKVVDVWRDSALKGGVAVSHEAPKEVQEAQTEHEWAINARDSKKESRTIWWGVIVLSAVGLVTAIFEMTK